MKQLVRSFSIGLFTAGILLLIVFYFFDNPKNQSTNLSVDEMVDEIKDKGYRVLTESEYISLSVKANEAKTEEPKENKTANKEEKEDETNKNVSKDEKKQDQKENEKEVTKYTLHIESGMPSSEIGNLLADNNIIDDASKFNKYLEDEGYSLRVQLGNFDVNSEMSYNEIAEAITR